MFSKFKLHEQGASKQEAEEEEEEEKENEEDEAITRSKSYTQQASKYHRKSKNLSKFKKGKGESNQAAGARSKQARSRRRKRRRRSLHCHGVWARGSWLPVQEGKRMERLKLVSRQLRTESNVWHSGLPAAGPIRPSLQWCFSPAGVSCDRSSAGRKPAARGRR